MQKPETKSKNKFREIERTLKKARLHREKI